jgi:glutamate dehydrogenase (NAD(P)+)
VVLLAGDGGQRRTGAHRADVFDAVMGYAESRNIDNRIAAYMLAIDRVAYTLRQRGIYA